MHLVKRVPRRHQSSGPTPAPGRQWQRRELVIWGAHGGAGTSTLAVWLQPAWDMGAMRPEPDPPYPAAVAHGRVVVCRNTTRSAQQAADAVQTVTSKGGQVAVLAVVSDGWPEPATATRRFRELVPQVGAMMRIPFARRMRSAGNPADVLPPRKVRRALGRIQAAAGRKYPI